MLAKILLSISIIGLSASTVFLGIAIVAALRFRRSRAQAEAEAAPEPPLPSVTILKPLHGLEPMLRESLESAFVQDYPAFELIFGARTASDPALDAARELAKKYRKVPVKIVLSGEPQYPNAKVFALGKMIAAASNPVLVIADSDVRVGPDYLASVVRPLLAPEVGLVTCLYRGVPTGGFWSRLEALGMSVEMTSGVLAADLLEGMKFALGPTMAARKETIESLGGIGVLGSYCADDFVLGARVAESGKRVELSRHVIDHIVLNRSARQSLLHQARWMKSGRFSRPAGHIGTGLTFAMPYGILGLIGGALAGNWILGGVLLGAAVLNRLIQSIVVGWGVVRDRRSLTFCWLYPLRDLLGFFLWCASYCGSEIVWRGERYRLANGGGMARRLDAKAGVPGTYEKSEVL